MKRNEQDQLLNEILDGEELSAFRQASLDRTLASVRRQRQQRRIARACALACLPLLLVVGILLHRAPGSTDRAVTIPNEVPAARVKFITDEELFALFPGRPMALIGKPGQQQLVFLDQTESSQQ